MVTHYFTMYFLNTLWILKLNEIISIYPSSPPHQVLVE